MLTESGSPASGGSIKFIHPHGMEHLGHVLPYLEEVSCSDGGHRYFCDGLGWD
jgi:hypothetical protein